MLLIVESNKVNYSQDEFLELSPASTLGFLLPTLVLL